jgi:hypothetical protein
MSGGTSAFVTLKGCSPLSCTGTMDQDLSCGRAAGPDIANTAGGAKGDDQGIPAPYPAALPNRVVFPAYRAAGGGQS